MRGEVYLATVGTKTRPVVEISAPLIDRPLVAHFTTIDRAVPTQVAVVDVAAAGVDRQCWINLLAIEPFDRNRLGPPIGRLDPETLWGLCGALAIATGCDW
ncbi:MAG: type II toxin-antitoxin system PemK/MazF family toxin [Acidimicrobiia bacterium]|nr:type II toxin-antitoxin system PemK/MazF family toxin [Acidimicrobiia bacterium]MDH5519136.1 type II toxin-antitoxin system PemK/MazF family toxin [Acidimicrobiia bacterium]